MDVMISLTLNDRCDCCAAAAKHVARKGDLELMFCNHHFNRTKHKIKHEDALAQDGWTLITDTYAVERDNYNPLLADVEPEYA